MSGNPDEDLNEAIRFAASKHPEGFEAGPKALLTAVQAGGGDFSGVSIQKFKRALAKVKTAVKEEGENARIEAAKPTTGSAENCPGRHGLARFATNHNSYCCNTCRCYLALGAPMWGCRECNWNVCEGRCHPVGVTLSDLQAKLSGLEKQVESLRIGGEQDVKTKLALIETEVHKLEKMLDNAMVADLVKLSVIKITDEEARSDKKVLIAGSGNLLVKIEGIFATITSKAEAPNTEVSEEYASLTAADKITCSESSIKLIGETWNVPEGDAPASPEYTTESFAPAVALNPDAAPFGFRASGGSSLAEVAVKDTAEKKENEEVKEEPASLLEDKSTKEESGEQESAGDRNELKKKMIFGITILGGVVLSAAVWNMRGN